MSDNSPLRVIPPATPPPRPASITNEDSVIRHLTPENQAVLKTLKRKASELADQPSPREPNLFLLYQLKSIRNEIAIRQHTRTTLPATEVAAREQIRVEQDALLEEESRLLKQGKFFAEDMQDSLKTAEQAYIDDLYRGAGGARKSGQKEPKLPTPLDHQNRFFAAEVEKRLDAVKYEGSTKLRHCVVLDKWILAPMTKVAHIVPKSLLTKELDYLFGVGDAALSDARNGLILNRTIEQAYDDGWLTIVPLSDVSTTPTEWKVLILKRDNLNDACVVEEGRTWKWWELDGRPLHFNNENRPARRYLYFKYTMAIMQAQRENNPFLSAIPSGKIWASPGKKDGYLRRSTLRSLARQVGDQDLPDELIEAGTFVDTSPATGSPVLETIAAIEVGLTVRKKLDDIGKGKAREAESEEEGSGGEEESIPSGY
ncbi:MAG: hypothetical protein M1836_001740 [Candelina mexicana]|nr:MAG: hypothetical protein M1836_001740 [Candelina mexicana]